MSEQGTPTPSSGGSSGEGRGARRPRRDDDPVVPDRAAEDRPEAWGERPDEDDDERYLRDRPPHW